MLVIFNIVFVVVLLYVFVVGVNKKLILILLIVMGFYLFVVVGLIVFFNGKFVNVQLVNGRQNIIFVMFVVCGIIIVNGSVVDYIWKFFVIISVNVLVGYFVNGGFVGGLIFKFGFELLVIVYSIFQLVGVIFILILGGVNLRVVFFVYFLLFIFQSYQSGGGFV